MKVLYVDALSAPNAVPNVTGMRRAYGRVAEVEVFDYRLLAKRHGRPRMNELLVGAAKTFKPDFVHLGKCESVTGSAVAAMKRVVPGLVVCHFFGDYREQVIPWVVDIGRSADWTLMQIDGGPLVEAYRQVGCRRLGYWPAGTDPDLFRPVEVPRERHAAFFGTLAQGRGRFGWYGGREELVTALSEAGIAVHTYGNGWNAWSRGRGRVFNHKWVGAEGFSEACSRASISLGYGTDQVPGYTSWPRLCNSIAAGTLYLTRYFPGIERHFNHGEHLLWFKSVEEAVELARWALENEVERAAIAQRGREEILRAHTWDVRIAWMLDFAREAGLKV